MRSHDQEKNDALSIQPGQKPGCIRVSVRSLVEFLLRNGDIDNRRRAGHDAELMLEGANAHRMIQRLQGGRYRAEVPLMDIISREGYDIILEGRADGIITEEHPDSPDAEGICDNACGKRLLEDFVTIDEIKSSHRDLEFIKSPDPIHLAQAKCYACMYLKEAGLASINVRMTYANLDSHDVKYFHEHYTAGEITAWYNALMESYYRWSDYSYYWQGVRSRSIEGLRFPFIYRDGQRELVAQVYKSLSARENLFIQASTGVGKTIATIYPALKAMGEGKCEKLFYLTAKTITRTVAADCFTLLREQPFSFKTLMLTAKEKICPLTEPECNPDSCAFAKGHFDRINDAIYDLLTSSDSFSREDIEAASLKHRVCPFELSLDLSLFADCVICDYNYVFDPNVYLKRFFTDNISGNYYFLIDEAHNLTDRAMDMYSALLYKEQFLEINRIVKSKDSYLSRLLNKTNKFFLEYKRECEDYMVLDSIDDIILSLNRVYSRLDDFLEKFDKFDERDIVLEFFFDVRHFLNMFENMGKDDYVIYSQLLPDGRFMIKLLCANPASSIRRCCERGKSAVFFSATLLPIGYYKNMLGAAKDAPAIYAKSVFDPKKRGIFIANDVTTRYKRRGIKEYEKIAAYISAAAAAKSGNYMIFFPSHSMMHEVYEIYAEKFHDASNTDCLLQSSSMSEEEREKFIARFSHNDSDRTLLGFCVLGGIFSEGIDLKADALIGAIIVGTGLPQICIERNLLKNRYTLSRLDGFGYAYRYPGMNKVLQAGGRVIRTVADTGIVVLLDERFLEQEYLSMLPREWADFKVVNITNAGAAIKSFWDEHPS